MILTDTCPWGVCDSNGGGAMTFSNEHNARRLAEPSGRRLFTLFRGKTIEVLPYA